MFLEEPTGDLRRGFEGGVDNGRFLVKHLLRRLHPRVLAGLQRAYATRWAFIGPDRSQHGTLTWVLEAGRLRKILNHGLVATHSLQDSLGLRELSDVRGREWRDGGVTRDHGARVRLLGSGLRGYSTY